jgi:uncharacterized protein
VAQLEAAETARLALETRTLDRLAPGEQQPEVEHSPGRRVHDWRHERPRLARGRRLAWLRAENPASAKAGGPLALLATYSNGQRDRQFGIVVNRRVIASVALSPARAPALCTMSACSTSAERIPLIAHEPQGLPLDSEACSSPRGKVAT